MNTYKKVLYINPTGDYTSLKMLTGFFKEVDLPVQKLFYTGEFSSSNDKIIVQKSFSFTKVEEIKIEEAKIMFISLHIDKNNLSNDSFYGHIIKSWVSLEKLGFSVPKFKKAS